MDGTSTRPGPSAGVPFLTEHPDPEHALPQFSLLIQEPREVDYLEINGNSQNRWEFHRGDGGLRSGAEVNP
jgi:hypothetical protein